MSFQESIITRSILPQRFYALLFDYSLLAVVLLFALLSLDLSIPLFALLVAVLFTPLLFIPIEAICIKVFSTTPGKFLFGLRYEKDQGGILHMKEILQITAYKGLSIQLLVLPIINFFTIPRAYRHFKSGGEPVWDTPHSLRLHMHKKKRWEKFSSLAMILAFFGLQFATIRTDGMRDYLQNENEMATTTSPQSLGWKSVHPEDSAFSAYFPKDPTFTEQAFPIPNSSQSLPFVEYFHTTSKDPIRYSVSYIDLPSSWLKWSSNLILKGALEILVKHSKGSRLVNKKKVTKNGIPGYAFTLSQSSDEIKGEIYLVGNRLYKIEGKYPKSLSENQKEKSRVFIQSLHLKR